MLVVALSVFVEVRCGFTFPWLGIMFGYTCQLKITSQLFKDRDAQHEFRIAQGNVPSEMIDLIFPRSSFYLRCVVVNWLSVIARNSLLELFRVFLLCCWVMQCLRALALSLRKCRKPSYSHRRAPCGRCNCFNHLLQGCPLGPILS